MGMVYNKSALRHVSVCREQAARQQPTQWSPKPLTHICVTGRHGFTHLYYESDSRETMGGNHYNVLGNTVLKTEPCRRDFWSNAIKHRQSVAVVWREMFAIATEGVYSCDNLVRTKTPTSPTVMGFIVLHFTVRPVEAALLRFLFVVDVSSFSGGFKLFWFVKSYNAGLIITAPAN